jgi:glycosyltransferase involved in cell wall biosynthesis
VAQILFLTQVLPYPLDTGARVRQYYVLRHLCQKHAVTLVSFVRPDDKPQHVAHLKEFCSAVYTVPMTRSRWRDGRAVIKGLAQNQPFIIVRDEIEAMQSLLTRLMASEHFDVIHADQVSMAQYGLMGRGPRRVLDMHNALYLVVQRLADNELNPVKSLILRREARVLARYEAELCRKFDKVVFVTAEDRRVIEARISEFKVEIPDNHFHTIPICVDPEDKRPVTPVANPFRVTALGVMFWPPNAEGVKWFASEGWPQVHAQFPDVRLTIVGKNPPPELTRLNGSDHIEVAGYVPDLSQILSETAVLIVPLHAGGGMRVKILDNWSRGLPIVSTSIGAEGIDICDQENILIADTSAAFSQSVQRVLGEPALNQALRENGRRWVEQKYDWHAVYGAWDEVYAELLRS